MPFVAFLLIAAGIALVAFLVRLSWKAEQKRREAFRAWAARHGWSYRPERDRGLAQRYRFLDKLRQGSNRYACHVLEGEWEGTPSCAFTYHYETHSTDSKGRRQTHHHWFGVILCRLPRRFPELCIHPESLLGRLGQMLGFDDIDFESDEFSRAFTVRSPDERFAWDFCHARTMEYLLAHRKTALELEEDVLALYDSGRLDPDEIEPYLAHLHRLRALMPAYLFEESAR